jgi:hypothetical protein
MENVEEKLGQFSSLQRGNTDRIGDEVILKIIYEVYYSHSVKIPVDKH